MIPKGQCQPEPKMSPARTVAEVLQDHVPLEVEGIYRMCLNVYVSGSREWQDSSDRDRSAMLAASTSVSPRWRGDHGCPFAVRIVATARRFTTSSPL